jgi:hypothetical protein
MRIRNDRGNDFDYMPNARVGRCGAGSENVDKKLTTGAELRQLLQGRLPAELDHFKITCIEIMERGIEHVVVPA